MPRAQSKSRERKAAATSKDDDSGNVAQDSHEKSNDKPKHHKRFNPSSNKSRGPRSYYGKNHHSEHGDRRNFKKPRFEVGERLKETDLGITEYAGDTKGFDGTIKERFSDFVVHEINLDGEIAQLTDQTIPPEPEELINLEDLKKKIPESTWDELQKISHDASSVEIDVTNVSREQRKYIHQIVKKLSSYVSETKDVGDKKVIVFSKAFTRQDIRQDWSDRGGDYCHFILHKFNMDTMDALNQLARVLRLKSNIFTYSGTKDRRAKTTQWISVRKMNPSRIMGAARRVKNLFVGNFKFAKEPLKLGKLQGNMFTMAIRNVSAPDDIIEKAFISLRDKGFINYYGLQRFGAIAAIPTHEIGKALLQGNWEEAVDLILKPRDGEQDPNLAEAREIYKNTKDSRAAYQKIYRVDKVEAKVLWGLNICGQKNLVGALDCVPRNQMLMYVHAYQSKLWNTMVSRRIKEYGLKPVVGDLVYENPESKDDFTHDDHTHDVHDDEKSDKEESAEISVKKESEANSNTATAEQEKPENSNEEKEDKPAEKDSKSESEKSSEKSEKPLPKVKVLAETDLANYTIADIIMPLPGWKVTYPTYAKQWFEQQLEQDGLTPELKQKNKKYTLSGSYRKIIQIPQSLEWKIIRFNAKTADLILSDIEKLRDKEPVKHLPEGKFKAVVIKMALKSSAYATMALREALKCDTSTQTHAAQSAAFQEAHEKSEEAEKANNKQDQASETNEKSNVHTNGTNGCVTEDEENDKTVSVTSSLLESSVEESAIKHSSSFSGPQKHEVDPTNDSGIDTSTIA